MKQPRLYRTVAAWTNAAGKVVKYDPLKERPHEPEKGAAMTWENGDLIVFLNTVEDWYNPTTKHDYAVVLPVEMVSHLIGAALVDRLSDFDKRLAAIEAQA